MQEPLRTVKNFVNLIDKKYRNQLDDNADRYLQFITDATTRMSDLVKGLLDYSRIGVEKRLSEVNCNELLENIQLDLKTLISENNAAILLGNLPIIKAYPTELRVLFQNLIVNAIKFKKEDTEPIVKISCQNLNNYWKFSVEDNGIGIADEDQEKIFIIFQRLHHNSNFEGTGIGLAHSQRIVGLHDGKIWVESKVGKGSTFYFTISKNLFNS
jgi:light-regulated signal transduction histidine kinase (bacteriophytochrome)